MVSKEQIAHDLAVVIAKSYIDDAVKNGEYQEAGIDGAAMDALSVYQRAYDSILNAK